MIFLQSKIQTIYEYINKIYINSNNKHMDKKVNKKKISKRDVIYLVLSGILIGVLNGFFGGGGGMICVPAIKKIMEMKDKNAHATTVFIMSIISIPSLIIYITNFGVNFQNTIPVIIGVVIGGWLGAKLLSVIKNDILNLIFIILMIGAGIKMLF